MDNTAQNNKKEVFDKTLNNDQPINTTQRIMETKMRMAEDPNSIVFVPIGGEKGFEFGKNLLDLNRHVKMLKNSAVFGDMDNIKKKLEEIENLKDEIWDKIKSVIPRLSTFPVNKWYELNNSKDEKIRLAQRRMSFVIIPVDNTVGSILVAAKVLTEKIIESQSKSDFIELSEVVDAYRVFSEKIADIVPKRGTTGKKITKKQPKENQINQVSKEEEEHDQSSQPDTVIQQTPNQPATAASLTNQPSLNPFEIVTPKTPSPKASSN